MTSAKKSRKAPTPSAPAPAAARAGFPIVGIGASAGGLDAFERFFQHVPGDTGMAFVLVPHLDPSHGSILTDILQRATAMPVVQATDQLAVQPNHVYVIPPNREMGIISGTLQLSVPEQPRGQRMPIDAFLRSLADDQGERAIGIVLSGTGTDGTQGLRAILGAGGITLVQQPDTAKYEGMPSSAIGAGFASHVLPAEKMAEALLVSLRRLPLRLEPPAPAPAAAKSAGIGKLLMLLRSATGHDFSLYKKSTITRRIERRMAQHDLADVDTYQRYLKENPTELQALFKELLINVTSFFRDPEAFAALKTDALPPLCANKNDNDEFRVWVAGCASGEEAYSLAILLLEYLDGTQQDFKVQIYATDLDDDAINTARTGCYPPNIAQDMTPERLHRFFVRDDGGYRVKKEVREMVVFAVQNVIKDPPFTKLDLLSCRNLMIYLEPELQNRMIPAFHYALKPDGVLFLSPSETIGNHTELFTAINRKWKLYRARSSSVAQRTLMRGGFAWTTQPGARAPEEVSKKGRDIDCAEQARRALLQSFAPASVLTDVRGNILFVHGETGKYLRPAPGQATLNVVEMAREGLQLELRAALHTAATQGTPSIGRQVTLKSEGEPQAVALSVRPLASAESDQARLLVSFEDVIPAPATTLTATGRRKRAAGAIEVRRVAEIENDLAYTRENLQATIEEQQTSNEELKSTNEELQSTNEELQSTNEELETSKEELQSVNEELVTVNAELQAKIEQLASMQNDMRNLLDNINIGTIFLDQSLAIRRFTRDATRIFRLVATDVGRALVDIKSDLEASDDALNTAVRQVLDTLVPWERELRTRSGQWFLAHIQPYRTLDNVIDGVVLTFTDINTRVAAEAAERRARRLAEGIVDTVREPLVVLDGCLQVVTASLSFYRHFSVAPDDTVGRPIYELGNRQWDIPALRELLETILPRDNSFEGFVVEHDFPTLGRQRVKLNARRLMGADDDAALILLAIEHAEQGETAA